MATDAMNANEEETHLDWMAGQLDTEMDVVENDSDLLTDTDDEDLGDTTLSSGDDEDEDNSDF